MTKNLDLTLLPLYRLRGNELPSPPGLMALTPPRRTARSRDKDRLIVHLTLVGNAPFSTVNYLQMTSAAAESFYQTPGSVTSALRAAAITLNGDLLERNMEMSGQGRYSTGQLVLGALRDEQLYILEAGGTHAYWMADAERKHIHDAVLSGRGLGMGQATNVYLSQLTVHTGGRLLLTPKFPPVWEQILERNNHTAPLEILRNALMRQSIEDENAVLIEVSAGRGLVSVLKPVRPPQPTLEIISKRLQEEPTLPELPAQDEVKSHQPEPLPVAPLNTAATAVAEEKSVEAPRPDNESKPPVVRNEDVLASIPRRAVQAIAPPPPISTSAPALLPNEEEFPDEAEEEIPSGPSTGEVFARQSARAIAKGMQLTRASNQKLKAGFEKMLPRLLPGDDSDAPVRLPTWVMSLIAVVIPLIVVTIASVVYFRFGRDLKYDGYLTQAQEARSHAIEQNDQVAQRLAWENTLHALDQAEERKSTDETRAMRIEAQNHIDALLGILRLGFKPAINGLPRNIKISRIAANDSELFLLDEGSGEVLRAYLIGNGYQFDDSFICKAGNYGGKTIDKLVEIQVLPKSNAMSASILAFDSQGGLLYCAANNMPQVMRLEAPTVGFREITAVALQSDVLYVLDAVSHEVWVYGGQASTFIKYPLTFFTTQAPTDLQNAIDMSINDTDLYLLFKDGHLASCTYSLIDSVPTRCTNPVQLVDSNPAAGGGNAFGNALFTEMHLSDPPDAAILLLAAETQSVFRFSPRSYELQNQLQARSDTQNALPAIALTALTTNANHVLFIAQDDQVFMAVDAP